MPSTVPPPPTRRGRLARPELPGAPLGPGSLTWAHFGDARHLLLTTATGTLQTMHPVISQALLDHSDFFADPLDRLRRSAAPILGVIYDRDPDATARGIRDWHKPIRSSEPSDAGPRGYRALDPEVFYWAHATFYRAIVDGRELFGTPLTAVEQRQLYAESVTWYRRYGMSMRPVPDSLEAFDEYWDHMLADVLAATPVAAGAVRRGHFPVPPVPQLPTSLWRPVEPLFARHAAWITRGGLPPAARAVLGVGWTAADAAAWALLVASIRRGWPLVPRRFRQLTQEPEGCPMG